MGNLEKNNRKPGIDGDNVTEVADAVKTYDVLRKKFSFYQASNLAGISPDEFERSIRSRIGVFDPYSEGYSDNEIEEQRDLSIKFHWGHNHDFGTFKLEGMMGDRHLRVLDDFLRFFDLNLDGFKNKRVFDIGCWTGGTTLLLAAIAEKVHAIEEVKKYAATTSFLAESFGIERRVSVSGKSIYQCNASEYHDRFDIVFFPGVIYHVTDPLLALRILFNSLKPGGFMLVESAGIDNEEPFCRFEGSRLYHSGTKKDLNRGGWNWFLPSPSALGRMMEEVGLDQVRTIWSRDARRVYGYGKKTSHVGICKAGWSVTDIK